MGGHARSGPAKSDLLRVQDVRDAYRLIGECRDLGSEPALWQEHLIGGVRRLVGVPGSSGGEGVLAGPRGPVFPLSSFDAGLDAGARECLAAYVRARATAIDPLFRAVRPRPGRVITRTRRQVVADSKYYRSEVFHRYLRPGGADHRMVSLYQVRGGPTVSVVHVYRPPGERDFSPREQRVLEFLYGELGPVIGRQLASVSEPGPDALSPRLRQTLVCLAQGDSEKHVAARLGISPTTAHQYVGALYRHFRVHSRAQLLAHLVKRAARGDWRRVLENGAKDNAGSD